MASPTSRRRASRAALALLVAIAGLFAGAPVDHAQAVASSAPTLRRFGGIRSSSHYVTMRDGVRLAVDVHLPKGLAKGERTATILHLTRYYRSVAFVPIWRPFMGNKPYGITERDTRPAFVKAGYAWVDVDVRGSGASFGTQLHPLSDDDVRDASDVIDWIVSQPWSAGVVGATGTSYNGSLAMMLARSDHPALKAVAPRFSAWDLYEDVVMPGGLQAASLISAWSRLTLAFDRSDLIDVFGWKAWGVAAGVYPVDKQLLPLATATRRENVNIEALLKPIVYRDDRDWRGMPITIDDLSPHARVTPRIPVYSYGGWFDGALPRGQLRQYLASAAAGGRVRIGPWFHAGLFNASPYARGGEKAFDHNAELLRFFDAHLRGVAAARNAGPRVDYYTMGQERWKTSNTWPPPGVEWRSLFLAADHRLADAAAAEGEADDRYQVDRELTSGQGSRWGLIVTSGGQRRYGDRRDRARRLLSYTSRPLAEPLEVTGHPRVHLHMAINTTDAGVFGYLEDVAPDGRVRYITEGQLRLIHRPLTTSHAESLTPVRTYRRIDGKQMVPGIVDELRFDLLPTSFEFPAGHSIRLSIAGADDETFRAPLLVDPLIYRLHRDRQHQSRLELPTYSGGEMKAAFFGQ